MRHTFGPIIEYHCTVSCSVRWLVSAIEWSSYRVSIAANGRQVETRGENWKLNSHCFHNFKNRCLDLRGSSGFFRSMKLDESSEGISHEIFRKTSPPALHVVSNRDHEDRFNRFSTNVCKSARDISRPVPILFYVWKCSQCRTENRINGRQTRFLQSFSRMISTLRSAHNHKTLSGRRYCAGSLA